MVQQLDPRELRLGVQIGGAFQIFEGLRISAVGAKYADNNYGECEIQVANLEKAARNQLLTETSPYNRSRVIKRVFLDVGRRSTGPSRFFQGDIIRTSVSQPPDVTVTIRALTGLFAATDVITRSHPALIQLSELSQFIANDIGVGLSFQATDKQVANYSYAGGALHQLRKLNEAGDIAAFIDNDTLYVTNRGVPRQGQSRVINRNNGMVGIPEVLEHGVRVSMLWNNEVVVGGSITIESDFYAAAAGTYTVYKLGFEVSNRDKPFYITVEAVRDNGTVFPVP